MPNDVPAKRSGSWKVFLAITLAAVLVVISIFVYAVVNRKRIYNQNREYLTDSASRLAQNIDGALSDGYDNVKILSDLISESLTKPEVDVASLQMMISDSVFDFVEFADKDGWDHNITGGVSDARDRKYYLDAMDGNIGLDIIYNSRATHETLLMFYSPVYFEDEIIGSIVGVYQAANRITELLTVSYFGESATSYLCTPSGRVVASNLPIDTNEEMYMTDLAEGDTNLSDKLNSSLKTGRDLVFITEKNGTGSCVKRLEDNGWYLVHSFPQAASEQMASDANALAIRLVLVIVAAFIAVLVSVAIFSRRHRRELVVANSAKTSFLFNMSHDIRTPMNAIMGYSAMAGKYIDDPEKVKDCLTKIDGAGASLLELINEVLDMARIESGKSVLEDSRIDIRHKVESIVNVLDISAKEKGINLKVSTDIKNRYVLADAGRLSQILNNVISNAIKYTPAGGKVTFAVTESDHERKGYGFYEFAVEDNGIGMSREFLDHLFEEFAREQNTTMSGVQGTGLGMSIVKKTVEMFGGKIDVQSEQGKGTKVTVGLPLKTDDSLAKHEEDTYASGDVSLTGRRVLLVEDNELNREIACDVLDEMNLIVETAEDGDIAVEMVRSHGPWYYDAVLMDIQMPRMNGYEATKAIRSFANRDLAETVIIAMTANAFAEDRKAALEAGMNEHIAKPINPDVLKSVLIKYLRFDR